MESDQNHISKVGIQKILELNCQKTTGMTDTHTHNFAFHGAYYSSINNCRTFSPFFWQFFPHWKLSFRRSPPNRWPSAAQEAPVTPPVPPYGRVTAVHPFRIPNSTAEVNLRSPWGRGGFVVALDLLVRFTQGMDGLLGVAGMIIDS